MFWEKKCKGCKEQLKADWIFCPSCGTPVKEVKNKDLFQDIDREFKEIDKMMEMKIPKFMLKSPLKGRGLSITITSDNVSPPKINVKPIGEHRHHHHEEMREEKPVRVPSSTEEPDTKIHRDGNRQTISLNLPDVKDLQDIEIKQLHQSIEIKAFAGDKAYFKLIPIPSHATVNNEFKDGVLKIEVLK